MRRNVGGGAKHMRSGWRSRPWVPFDPDAIVPWAHSPSLADAKAGANGAATEVQKWDSRLQMFVPHSIINDRILKEN